MDFGASTADRLAEGEAQESPKRKAANEKIDANAAMAQMREEMEMLEQQTGQKMNPEDKAQLMQILAQAMSQANQTEQGEGAAKELWQIIPPRGNDAVGYEMKIGNTLLHLSVNIFDLNQRVIIS